MVCQSDECFDVFGWIYLSRIAQALVCAILDLILHFKYFSDISPKMEIYTVYPWHCFQRLSERSKANAIDGCLLFSAIKDWDQARDHPIKRFPHPGTGSLGGKVS